jgi:exopolyphosphatase/guanosine-5'-triphosphate,3'-diphosphate pyrophosphatase
LHLKKNTNKIVAIDLGSNTIRVTKLNCQTKKFEAEYEKLVKTADGLSSSKLINKETLKRVIVAIKEAKAKVDFSDAEVKAVTTEAMRQAKNSNEILKHIADETGVKFKIIDGDEEARLTLLAVTHRLKMLELNSKNFVLVDIGGGSTELIFNFNGKKLSKSFQVGIVTMAQKHKTLKHIESALPLEMQEMKLFVQNTYSKHNKIDFFVATAGTPTTVASMKLGHTHETYNAKEINGTTLSKDELDFYLKKLLNMPFEKREKTVGTGRSDLISAGILIYKQIFEILNLNKCTIIDDGLREGIALDLLLGK